MNLNTYTHAPRSVAVAVSGGVDSLFALASLHAQGLARVAVHARFLQPAAEKDPVPELEKQCAKLGVPLHVVDLRDAFMECVIQPFVSEYAAGHTPNPCAWCNPRMKFGVLLDTARELGAEYIATGHYAEWKSHPVYGFALHRGADKHKDQSYFLAMVPGERLSRALFPLAGISKAEARARVSASGLDVPLPSESQEICFVPGDEYRSFVGRHASGLSGPGEIRLRDGQVVGRHNGLWQYTEGQRRGLGIAWQEPLYVIGKERESNVLLVGTRSELMVNGCLANRLNAIVPPALWPGELYVQTRYRQSAVRADVRIHDAVIEASFHEPQTPSAPGQVLVIYDTDGYVLGGAAILENGV